MLKIQPMKDLMGEMKAVARGEIAAPTDAALPSVESAKVLLRVLTSDTPRRTGFAARGRQAEKAAHGN
jgi:hypothetical protein